jgi:hypothetical protein
MLQWPTAKVVFTQAVNTDRFCFISMRMKSVGAHGSGIINDRILEFVYKNVEQNSMEPLLWAQKNF